MTTNIHASCISINGRGILFIGDSGAGKSDLSLRLIWGYQAVLVADDRVDIETGNGIVKASSPKNLQGLMEVRGVGIIKRPFVENVPVCAVIGLISDALERMPKNEYYNLCGVNLPFFKINPFEFSAPEKVLAALSLL